MENFSSEKVSLISETSNASFLVLDSVLNTTAFSITSNGSYGHNTTEIFLPDLGRRLVAPCSYNCNDKTCAALSDGDKWWDEKLRAKTEPHQQTVFSLALALGLPGSVFAVLTVLSMKKTPTTIYMGFLAVSDFVCLLLASLSIYKVTNDAKLANVEEKTLYVWRIFRAFSHWDLALICLERFVAIRYPMRKQRYYTNRAVIYSILVALVISSIPAPLSYVSLFQYGSQNACLERSQAFLYMSIYFYVPFVLVSIFTALSARQIKLLNKSRIAMTSQRNLTRTSVAMETQLTRMMFLTVACFGVFTLPWAVINTMDSVLPCRWCKLQRTIFYYVFNVTMAFSGLNHSVNFYVYCACAKGFREQFAQVICCSKLRTSRL